MDEKKTIEKTMSELKTIQNRLGKILKKYEPIDEVNMLKARISSLSAQVDDAFDYSQKSIYEVEDLQSRIENYKKVITTLKNQRRILIEEIKKNRQINLLHVFEIAGDDYENKKSSEIILPKSFLKFRKNGLWGIKDNYGKIIIENKYMEIGSYNSKYIGFIHGEAEYINEVPSYNYNIPLAGKFKYSNNIGYAFDVGGVDCYIPVSQKNERWFVPGEYYYFVINKITYGFKEIELTEVTFENTQI